MATATRRYRKSAHPSPRRRIALLSTLAVTAGVVGLIAPLGATTTVAPVEAGSPPVVRQSSVNITIDKGALSYFRSSSTAAFSALSAISVRIGTQACRGDNPTTGGSDKSPRDHITVTGPGGSVLDVITPVRDVSNASFFTSPANQPANPQPAPNNTNYRGDFSGNTYHGYSTSLSLTGKPAGIYTVTTTTTNMVKTGNTGACTVGTPSSAAGGFTPGPVVQTQQFEYRPWQQTFNDVYGAGKVFANVVPREFQFTLGAQTSPIFNGTGHETFYALPSGSPFMLPEDPSSCASDPASCVPSVATSCDPSARCVPRIMIINQRATVAGGPILTGAFDLVTRAFIVQAQIGNASRILMSLGTQGDALYGSTLNKLSTSAAAQGIDLPSLLATKVKVTHGDSATSVSLLNGLQISAADTAGGNGVQILSDATVQAGVILDIYADLNLSGPACATNVGTSATAPQRYARRTDSGYTVDRSDLVPSVPAAGPLAAIASGPLYHIVGKFNGATPALVNTASVAIGVDTAANEPKGYPVWVSPFVSPSRTGTPKTMDFLGTATWSASEKPVSSSTGCLVVDFMLGTGVAIYNNPTSVGFGTLLDPAMTPNAQAAALNAQIDSAVQSVTSQVTSDPTVNSVLTTITGALPL